MADRWPLNQKLSGGRAMKLLRMAALAAATLIAGSASAETVKIANIGHGYYSGALYVAVQE